MTVRLAALLALVVSPALVEAAGPPAKLPGDTSWTYRSREHGFSLTLPSSAWKRSPRKRFVADFYGSWWGSPMLAGVVSVRKQTLAEFRRTVKAARARAEKVEGLLSKPSFREEEAASGDRRAHLTLCEGGKGRFQYLFVAQSFVWLQAKGVTVEVLFEGQGRMRSKARRAREREAFEKAAAAIHRSVR